MRLVTDEMVPDSIGKVLEARHHKVYRVRDYLKQTRSDKRLFADIGADYLRIWR